MDRVPPAGDRPEVQRASLAPSRSGGGESKATKGGKGGGIMYTVYSKGGGGGNGGSGVSCRTFGGCGMRSREVAGKEDRMSKGRGKVIVGVMAAALWLLGATTVEAQTGRGGRGSGGGGDERRPDGSPERNVFRHPPAVEDGNGNAPRPSRSRLVHREAGYEDREGRKAGDQGIEGHV